MAADTLTRDDKVDRWVVLSAASSFVANLLIDLEAFPGFGGDDVSTLTPEESELFHELWPDDEDETGAEMLSAGVRSQALMASALARLASDELRERCLSEAARLAAAAAHRDRARMSVV